MIFRVTTLGCKVNQYESQSIEGILASRGHTKTETYGKCDVCVVNTCAVTAESARKSRQAIRRVKKLEPNALIAVCGCLSQLAPDKAIPLGADLVGGTGDRQGFADEIERLFQSRQTNVCIIADDPFTRSAFEELPPGSGGTRTRAALKIQDGCDNFCTYCVVPYARGSSRSLPLPRISEYAAQISGEGFREIVVTGIEISSYGRDLPGAPALPDALSAISLAAPNARIRLGSLDPAAITEDFCRKLKILPNLCNHFHLSLQSGCDETLSRMKRKYGAYDAQTATARLRDMFPDCGITADLIVGFPGETREEFEKTLEFIKESAFSDMHIFPFSPRPGTPAADMPDQIGKDIRRERARTASVLSAEMSHNFKISQIGKTVDVLFERNRDGLWLGHSANYIEITVERPFNVSKRPSHAFFEPCEGSEKLPVTAEKNSIFPIKIITVKDNHVFGILDKKSLID